MTGLAQSVPRVIALIDLPDLRRQTKRMGGPPVDDVAGVVRHVEIHLAALDVARLPAGLSINPVYTYSEREADGCSGCGRACTHCKAAVGEGGARGIGGPLAGDLLRLARDDAYDSAVVVSSDLALVPVVRFVQSRGRRIIHGCFPPYAADLTMECWASIDVRAFILQPAAG